MANKLSWLRGWSSPWCPPLDRGVQHIGVLLCYTDPHIMVLLYRIFLKYWDRHKEGNFFL